MSDEQAGGEVVEAPKPQWPVTVTLKHPVEFGETRITSLEFRRGKIGDMKGIKFGGDIPSEHLILVASRLCGQPIKVIEMLDIEDSGEVMDIALGFFVKFLVAAGRKR